ncbi:MAG TPA: DUF4255 domain-containing protein [Povalibacter sp.]|uniref:DUF4255 domain-containing protein n=1 Tax=Povalibacter sp. TaxID=1962978 RepID=UPI002CAAAE3B|nr:DUF4255 domain-containing protein [Povalibacter sp.]HMN44670.1 DUF4255 domain-containing protein [Povalibacter sp.]
MNYSGIQRVTVEIQKRLKEAIGTTSDAHVFIGPLHDDAADDAYLVLFLYRVVPNADLRNTLHEVPSADGTTKVYDKSLALDLHYILTAGGRQDGGERESLERLGRAMLALNERPLFTGSVLDNESVRLTAYPGTSDELSRVWALFPDQNYRTSVLYLASPVWIDPDAVRIEAPPVIIDRKRAGVIGQPRVA